MRLAADIGKGLLIAAVLVALLAGVFEVYLSSRAASEHSRLQERHGDRALCTQAAADARLVYEYIPNACGHNRHGFVDRERAFAKRDDVYRIVLIGDSVALGHGVPMQARFGDLLEAAYGGRVEVVNLARSGYSTSQELIVLEQLGLRFQPDLILWSYVLNDPAHPVYHDANGELGRYFHRPVWRGWDYFARKLFEARERWAAADCEPTYHALLHCAYRDAVARDVGRIGEVAGRAGVPVLFAIHPLLLEGADFGDYPHRDIHADLARFGEQAGLGVVDLIDALEGYSADELTQDSTLWFDPWHPNDLGHALIAQYLVEVIKPRISP